MGNKEIVEEEKIITEKEGEGRDWRWTIPTGVMAVSVFGAIKEGKWGCVPVGMAIAAFCWLYMPRRAQPEAGEQNQPPEEKL